MKVAQERRRSKRYNVIEYSVVICLEQQFRLVDISDGGLSVIYVHSTTWPRRLCMDLVFQKINLVINRVECDTKWDKGLDFRWGDHIYNNYFRRKGFCFLQPEDREIVMLSTFLEQWDRPNPTLLTS